MTDTIDTIVSDPSKSLKFNDFKDLVDFENLGAAAKKLNELKPEWYTEPDSLVGRLICLSLGADINKAADFNKRIRLTSEQSAADNGNLAANYRKFITEAEEAEGQEWYREHRIEWDKLVSEGWKFSSPEKRVHHLIGLSMKNTKTSSCATFYIVRKLSFRYIHSKLLEMAKSIAAADRIEPLPS